MGGVGRAQPELAEVTEGARHELELGLITSIVWCASSDSSARGPLSVPSNYPPGLISSAEEATVTYWSPVTSK